ncbi:hypothetical protein H6F88_10265 [Oculatella sp. FACHB-28]|uniref:general stress protein n=1 Tax=Cyanophyceae TaxID=3028117 RepID=UPI0016873A20|nr:MULTISPECIES: general stress protein [Cyanophyceae]MBD1871068.1 hypothetical protein [Cyanobacteria bacterium FACHB-471]MBD2056396.1 hypothetical protein [Oculatella sp. FACHB-28]MBD2070750.1 hypothetical protein [Leptolyngbya sp. FACHB-671]
MTIGQYGRAIGVFSSRQDAEMALQELRDAGFNMDRVSIIARNAKGKDQISDADMNPKEEQVKGGAGAGAVAGSATGGLLGLIGGLGVLAIPGVGPAAEVGIVLANTLLGSGIGAAGGSLVGALIGWGVPEDRAQYYGDRLEQGDYVLVLEGSSDDVRTAEAILNNRGIRDWDFYGIPGAVGNPAAGISSPTPGRF